MKRRYFLESTAAVICAILTGFRKRAVQRCAAIVTQAMMGVILIGIAAPRASADPSTVWLRIMAFTDAPVVGAEVRVNEHNSQGKPLVDAQAATNSQGVFPVAVRSHSSSFRISISGGTTNGNPFPWHLMADVELTDPAHQIVVVNPVTTLVSLVLDQRPDLKQDGAEALVRRFLKLPVNYPLGLALRQGSHYTPPFFSPVAFLTEALAAGGLDAFEHLLLQELASDSPHSFRPPKLLRGTNSTVTSDFEAGLEAAALDYAGANNAANLTGWAMSLTGLTAGSSGDISALMDELVELQSEIEDLSNEVAQLSNLVQSTSTQTQYNTIVVPAQTLATTVNTVEDRLAYFAQDCPPVPEGTPPPPPINYCVTEQAAIISELNESDIFAAYDTLESSIADNSTIGFRGMLHLYSLWLAQSKPFFRPADSTKMQNLYNYWDGVLAQAANLRVELLHDEGEQDVGGAQLIALLGNPDATPKPTTGTFQHNEAANLNLMFPPVPDGAVVATTDHTMWALSPWAGSDSPCQGCAPTKFSPAAVCYVWDNPFISSLFNPSSYGAYLGFTNWEPSPSYAQWQAAVAQAPPLSSGTEWRDWLTAQTQTGPDESPASPGFFNWTRVCAGGLGAWTTTLDYTSTYSYYWYMLPYNDSFEPEPYDAAHSGFNFPARSLAARAVLLVSVSNEWLTVAALHFTGAISHQGVTPKTT